MKFIVPGNCTFEIDVVEDSRTFSQKFDFLSSRLFVSCFKATEQSSKRFRYTSARRLRRNADTDR
jgi:hypothetical protein